MCSLSYHNSVRLFKKGRKRQKPMKMKLKVFLLNSGWLSTFSFFYGRIWRQGNKIGFTLPFYLHRVNIVLKKLRVRELSRRILNFLSPTSSANFFSICYHQTTKIENLTQSEKRKFFVGISFFGTLYFFLMLPKRNNQDGWNFQKSFFQCFHSAVLWETLMIC